jgi:hypothetical protein
MDTFTITHVGPLFRDRDLTQPTSGFAVVANGQLMRRMRPVEVGTLDGSVRRSTVPVPAFCSDPLTGKSCAVPPLVLVDG